MVVVSSSPEAPFVRRLAAELSLFGYRVEVATREASDDDDLSELLAQHGGAALIAVDQHRQTAEFVVGEPAGSGPFRHERERLDPRRQADTNAAVLAERFRARLTELGIAPSSAAAELAPAEAPPPPPPAAAPERRWWLVAAAGASSGGLGLAPHLELELRAFPVKWLSLSALGRALPWASQVRGPEGSADVRLFAAGLLVDVYPLRSERGDWAMKVGVAALALDAEMSGHASAPWQGRHDSVLVAAGALEAGAAWRVAPRFALELRGFVGVCAPRVAVRLAGRRAADFGQPFLGASLGGAVGVF